MEANIKELIKESIKASSSDATEAEKKMDEQVLTKIIEQKMSPREAMGFDKEFFEGIYAYAYNLFQSGNYQKAGDTYRILMSLEPKDARLPMGLGSCLHHLKKYEEAIPYYIQSGSLDPSDPAPYYHASHCFKQMNNLIGEAVMLQMMLEKLGDAKHELVKSQITRSLEELKEKIAKERKELLG